MKQGGNWYKFKEDARDLNLFTSEEKDHHQGGSNK